MFKKVFVRLVVILTAASAGGFAVAAVQSTGDAGASPAAPAITSPIGGAAASVQVALLTACAGRSIVASMTAEQSAEVAELVAQRALHGSSLDGNPLSAGVDYQAGVDDGLHIQAIDHDLAATLCPTP